MSYSPAQRLAAEALGTALLVATVVGSGIMAETLAGGNVGLALLANAIATGAILFVLITALGRARSVPRMVKTSAKVATPSDSHWANPVRTWAENWIRGCSNIACASIVPPTPPATCTSA